MERFAIKIDGNVRLNLCKICRLCGIDNPDKIPILEEVIVLSDPCSNDEEPELCKKISDCVGIQVAKGDRMPQSICTLCYDKVNDFFEFREMCSATDSQTRKLLGLSSSTKLEYKVDDDHVETILGLDQNDIKHVPPDNIARNAPISKRGRKRKFPINKQPENISKINNSEEVKNVSIKRNIGVVKTSNKTEMCIDEQTKNKEETFYKRKKGNRASLEICKKEQPECISREVVKNKNYRSTLTCKKKENLKVTDMTIRVKKQTISNTKEPPLSMVNRKKLILKKGKLGNAMPLLAEKTPNKREKSRESETKKRNSVAGTSEKPLVKKSKVNEVIKSDSICCSICHAGFKNKICLEKHLLEIHIPTVYPYHCVRCNESLERKDEIKNHDLWHKLSNTPYECGRCGLILDTRRIYTRHVQLCTVFVPKKIATSKTCELCKEEFPTQNLYNWHNCMKEKRECPKCGKRFTKKVTLLKHIVCCSNKAKGTKVPNKAGNNEKIDHTIIKEENVSNQTLNEVIKREPESLLEPSKVTFTPNSCVVIPQASSITESNISIAEEFSYEIGKKVNFNQANENLTQSLKTARTKDLRNCEELSKSIYTTFVSIKQEPEEYIETSFDNLQNIEIKQEPQDHENDFIEGVDIKNEPESTDENNSLKPALKLRIKKEHGTLNSSFVEQDNIDLSPLCSPRRKKKKKNKIYLKPLELAKKIKQEIIERELTSEFNINLSSNETKLSHNEADEEPHDNVLNRSNIKGDFTVFEPNSIRNADIKIPIISTIVSADGTTLSINNDDGIDDCHSAIRIKSEFNSDSSASSVCEEEAEFHESYQFDKRILNSETDNNIASKLKFLYNKDVNEKFDVLTSENDLSISEENERNPANRLQTNIFGQRVENSSKDGINYTVVKEIESPILSSKSPSICSDTISKENMYETCSNTEAKANPQMNASNNVSPMSCSVSRIDSENVQSKDSYQKKSNMDKNVHSEIKHNFCTMDINVFEKNVMILPEDSQNCENKKNFTKKNMITFENEKEIGDNTLNSEFNINIISGFDKIEEEKQLTQVQSTTLLINEISVDNNETNIPEGIQENTTNISKRNTEKLNECIQIKEVIYNNSSEMSSTPTFSDRVSKEKICDKILADDCIARGVSESVSLSKDFLHVKIPLKNDDSFLQVISSQDKNDRGENVIANKVNNSKTDGQGIITTQDIFKQNINIDINEEHASIERKNLSSKVGNPKVDCQEQISFQDSTLQQNINIHDKKECSSIERSDSIQATNLKTNDQEVTSIEERIFKPGINIHANDERDSTERKDDSRKVSNIEVYDHEQISILGSILTGTESSDSSKMGNPRTSTKESIFKQNVNIDINMEHDSTERKDDLSEVSNDTSSSTKGTDSSKVSYPGIDIHEEMFIENSIFKQNVSIHGKEEHTSIKRSDSNKVSNSGSDVQEPISIKDSMFKENINIDINEEHDPTEDSSKVNRPEVEQHSSTEGRDSSKVSDSRSDAQRETFIEDIILRQNANHIKEDDHLSTGRSDLNKVSNARIDAQGDISIESSMFELNINIDFNEEQDSTERKNDSRKVCNAKVEQHSSTESSDFSKVSNPRTDIPEEMPIKSRILGKNTNIHAKEEQSSSEGSDSNKVNSPRTDTRRETFTQDNMLKEDIHVNFNFEEKHVITERNDDSIKVGNAKVEQHSSIEGSDSSKMAKPRTCVQLETPIEDSIFMENTNIHVDGEHSSIQSSDSCKVSNAATAVEGKTSIENIIFLQNTNIHVKEEHKSTERKNDANKAISPKVDSQEEAFIIHSILQQNNSIQVKKEHSSTEKSDSNKVRMDDHAETSIEESIFKQDIHVKEVSGENKIDCYLETKDNSEGSSSKILAESMEIEEIDSGNKYINDFDCHKIKINIHKHSSGQIPIQEIQDKVCNNDNVNIGLPEYRNEQVIPNFQTVKHNDDKK